MKKKIFAITLCALIAAASIVGSTGVVDNSYEVASIVGITYVAEFAMNICKDAGYAAVGNQIELFAKLSILVLSIPVLTVFLETVGRYGGDEPWCK